MWGSVSVCLHVCLYVFVCVLICACVCGCTHMCMSLGHRHAEPVAHGAAECNEPLALKTLTMVETPAMHHRVSPASGSTGKNGTFVLLSLDAHVGPLL